MILRKIESKKAQGVGITELILMAAALFAVVIIGLGVWKGFDYIFSTVGFLPDNIAKNAQACGTIGLADEYSYCSQLREVRIGNVKQLINCDTLEKYAKFTTRTEPCTQANVDKAAIDECIGSKRADKFLINEKSCLAWRAQAVDRQCTNAAMGGIWKAKCAAGEEDITGRTSDYNLAANKDKSCCKALTTAPATK